MASSFLPALASTTTPLSGRRQWSVPYVQVSKLMLSKLKIEGEKSALCVASMGVGVNATLGSSKGGAHVLERPKYDRFQFEVEPTAVQEGGDIGWLSDKRGTGSGDSYRVLLLDDERHTENLVAKVLPQAVPSVTPDDAIRLFLESQQNRVAVVAVTVKEHAEFYFQMMIRGGLRSSIEPNSNAV
ncbi:hypothetical protein Cgig2_007142 [Carnegiea gigantea]|uniref:Adaptor protein ClpS core domain-containing protein n=1 Tax=Carnegiea gigantea TaxID=171969 RepID=A0A9Q1QL71_9CARY|nr:hypothetical protein Cgig2_007142 [Carnegiea gigantea]